MIPLTKRVSTWRVRAMATALLVCGNVATWAADAPAPAASHIGFTGKEIYPIDSGISLLRVADLDGDGLNDLVVVNNAHAKINLLMNQTGKTNQPAPLRAGKREVNELPPDARFRLESLPSEKRISSLVVTDLNGDGRPDLAYYGDPKELIVQYNLGGGEWTAPKRFAIEDGQLTANALCAGDLNGDGRPDLVLLGENSFYLLLQQEDHTLAEPRKIPFSGTARAARVVDVDQDGLPDLMLLNWEDRNPFRVRFQQKGGELGPEIFFSAPPIRAYCVDALEPQGKPLLITISRDSGRAQVAEFVRRPAERLSGAFNQGQFQMLPLTHTDKARRGVLWADLNRDGRPDLLVAEPESGQLSIYFQLPDGQLASPRTFPTLAGVTDLAVADWEDDGAPEIFLLSADERQVGVTRLDAQQRLPFPTLLPLEGKPLALAAGRLRGDAKPVLAVIVDQDGKRSLVTRSADGQTKVQKLNENFRSNPSRLVCHDVNQDGLMDLVVLVPYEKVKVLLQVPGQDFEEVDVAPPGWEIEQPWLSSADVDGDGKPELLLAQKNFLRAVVLKADASHQTATNRAGWTFTVKEQINGIASNSRLVSAVAMPNGTNAIPSLFLLDAERKALCLCERDANGVWQITRNLPLPLSDFSGLEAVALGSATPNAISFLGLNAVAWMPFGSDVWDLKELDSYETPIKDGRLSDVVAGDLDNDHRKELVFLETARNYLDVVSFTPEHKLVPANRWQVFEERTFRGRRAELPEPREAVVADVTGDGKNDLIVLVHDRVLVYPQE
jgi:hypothetical protein